MCISIIKSKELSRWFGGLENNMYIRSVKHLKAFSLWRCDYRFCFIFTNKLASTRERRTNNNCLLIYVLDHHCRSREIAVFFLCQDVGNGNPWVNLSKMTGITFRFWFRNKTSRRRNPELLLETSCKVFGVIETHFISNFGDIPVVGVLHENVFGHIKAVIA